MTGISSRIRQWFKDQRDPTKPPAFYGRASTLDGRYTPIKPEDRDAYEKSVRRLVDAAKKGYRR